MDESINLQREIIYEKVNNKLELFEKCLNEVGKCSCLHNVGLTKSYPYIDNVLYFVGKKSYPIDDTEELLMRNCIRREILVHDKTTSLYKMDNLIKNTAFKYNYLLK
jgi:hypothetical protein